MSFKQLGLRSELLNAIVTRGYKTATPIQAQSIPIILEGRDVLAGAQTGTGKTAAFALPIIQMLSAATPKGRNPRALILTPTRELAAQVLEFIEHYSKGLPLRSTVVFGGVNIRPQIAKLRKGIDILVATPGRLLDHAGQKTLDLSHIEILVLDEADRMLDMGFAPDIRKIMKLVPRKRQNLLFSATYSDEIKELASGILTNPALIEVATRNTTAENIAQVVHPVSHNRKRELLSKLIRDGKWTQVLVFTRTKHGANKLAKQLVTDNITATAIHGNKSQGARTRALADFKSGDMRVLVATDIAARGLDINLLPHVVNYELPDTSENYVHRIGRTGRAGANGKAVSLVCPEEYKDLLGIHKLLGHAIPVEMLPGFETDLTVMSALDAKPRRRQSSFRTDTRTAAKHSGRKGWHKSKTQGEKPSGHKTATHKDNNRPKNPGTSNNKQSTGRTQENRSNNNRRYGKPSYGSRKQQS